MSTHVRPSTAPFTFGDRHVGEFLSFGFVMRYDEDPLGLLQNWSRVPQRRATEADEDTLVRRGAAALRGAFAASAGRVTGAGEQVVLLSGGLDSRTILAALLDHFDTSEVLAATFGRPGEQDFDIAATVARVAGVRHETLESFSVEWSTRGLVDSVLARRPPVAFPFGQRYLSYALYSRLGPQHTFWDGLSGDVATGGMPHGEAERQSWAAATTEFLRAHLRPGTDAVVPRGYDPAASLPAEPFCPPQVLSYPDQLDFGIIDRCYSAGRLMRGYTILTPFLEQPWLDFMLSVPVQYRQRQHLYRQILKHAYPRLFSLPTTRPAGPPVQSRWSRASRDVQHRARRVATVLGMPPRIVPTGANAAIRESFRTPGPVRDVVVENLSDLRARGVVDGAVVAGLLADPMAEKHATSLVTLLVGLELNLKAVDEQRATATST